MGNLFFYGAQNLSNEKMIVSPTTIRFAPPSIINATKLNQREGVVVTNRVPDSKDLSLRGNIKVPDGSSLSLFKVIQEYKKALNENDRWLKVVREYVQIDALDNTTGWTLGGDGINLSVDEENFQYKLGSLKYDMNGNFSNQITLTKTLSAPIDLSGIKVDKSWYNNNWRNRIKITILSSQINSTETDFPVLVDLSDLPNSFWSRVLSTGADIVVTSDDKVTKLKRQLVEIDTGSKTGEFYFKAPSLSSTIDTDFYLYYNNPSASETNDTDVWDTNYKAVHHLSDATTSTVTDSTSNGNNGTKIAANEPQEVNGIIPGKAQDFDGVNDKITITRNAGLEPASITLEAWINGNITSGPSSTTVIVRKYGSSGYILRTDSNDKAQLIVNNGTLRSIVSTITLSDNTPYYISGTYNSSNGTLSIYVNGVLEASNVQGTGSILYDSEDVLLGQRVAEYWDGITDEVRISNIVRDADYFLHTYRNLSSPSTFYSLGLEEDRNTIIFASSERSFMLEQFIPENTGITNIELHIGNDGSNYYSGVVTGQLDTGIINNGWNLLVWNWDDMIITGTVDDSAIDYVRLAINYSSDKDGVKNWRSNMLLFVNESEVVNYKAFTSRFEPADDHYQISITDYALSFLIYEGIGFSTFSYLIWDNSGITSTTETEVVDMGGSYPPYPIFNITINSGTGLNSLSIQNNSNLSSIIIPGTFASDDSVIIDTDKLQVMQNNAQIGYNVFPEFLAGVNKLSLLVGSSGSETDGQTASNTFPTPSATTYYAQSFTPTISGDLTQMTIYGNVTAGILQASIFSDSAGSPGTNLKQYIGIGTGSPTEIVLTPTGGAFAITAATTYWLRIISISLGITTYWYYHTTGSYSGGQAKISTNSGSTWGNISTGNEDFRFSYTVQPPLAIDIDISASYRKLYL